MMQKLAPLMLALLLLTPGEALARERIALVIGNGAYPNIGELLNPPNDARLIGETLEQLGFEVVQHTNLSQKPLKRAIKAFGERLNRARKDALGLFYYAGHGVQVDGLNYLLPVNVDIDNEADVDIEAVSMNSVLQRMAYAGNDMNIVILDACRNNPFKRGFRSVSRGLARMDAARGTLIAYATAPGDVAADGSGRNSPYSAALASNLLRPGASIERIFKQVRNDVIKRTNSAQIPWESSSLTGADYYLTPGSAGQPDPGLALAGEDSPEVVFWQSIEDSNSTEAFEAYLNQYPEGVFAALARVKIKQLDASRAGDSGDQQVALSETIEGPVSRVFNPGSYKPKILSATNECRDINLGNMEADLDEINGSWRHVQGRGKIKITRETELVDVSWSGSLLRETRDQVRFSGKSLLIDTEITHQFGVCSLSFKLVGILP